MKDPTTIGFDANSRPDAVRLQNFRLDRILGEGGMGVVWQGKQLSPVQRVVAIKIIKSNQFDSSMMVRFEAERQALALMEHPHIATFLDAGVSKDGIPFFAMELVDGQPITTFCDQHQLDVPQRLRLFLQVASAVQHAHQKGVMHRDIKPSNVLVAGTQETPIVKVIDFGLAKALQPEVHLTRKTLDTQTGQILGTVQYMSPEQISAQLGIIDTRTDVFLLGVLLYEILVGVTPLVGSQRSTGRSVASMMDIITKADFPPPSRCIAANEDVGITAQDRRTEPHRLSQILSQDLDWVVMKTLRQEQAERYPTVQALADDVQRYLNGDPVLARSPTLGYRWKKFAGKHWAQLAVSAALLASLVFGIIGTTFGLIKANSATREAIAKSIEAEQLRLEADQQKEEAEASLQKITALNQRNERVLQFISDSFRKPNPYVAAHDVKVVDVLEQARYGVKSSGVIPAEKISVLASIANAYLGLGDYAATAEIYEEIDALFSQDDVLADDIFSVNFQIPWAESLMLLGKWDDAEAKIQLVTERLRTQFPDADTIYAADANNVMGHIYQLRNRYQEARSCYHRALELADESRMNVDQLRQTVSNNLCGLDMMSGDYDKAIQGFQQHIKMLKAQLGDKHMQVIVSQANLAYAFLQNGDSDRCIELLLEAIQQSNGRNGPLHPVTIATEVNLAGVYHRVGDIKNAAELSVHVAAKLKDANQIHDVALIDQLSGLGVVLGLSGMPEMALQVLDAAAVSSAKTRGPQHADTLVIKAKAARFCQLLGQMAESKNRLESVVPQMNDCPDVPIAERTVATNNLALARFQTGDPQAALQILQAVLPEMEEEFGVQHDNWLSAAGTLQWVYLQLGEFELAIQHSRKMLPVLEQKQRNSQELELVKTGLFEALVETGEYNEAFAPLQKIAESSRPESANYWRITSLMGTCHWKLGRHAEADQCLTQSAAGLEALRDKLPTYLTWWADRATSRLTQFRQQTTPDELPDGE